MCERYGFNNFAIYRARILYISSDVTYHLKRATINEAYIKKKEKGWLMPPQRILWDF